MSATFPQLLRRSAFVQHDPVITRVYASNPTQRAGDWGLKFPVYRKTKSRNIKVVGSLDGGPGVRAQWTSAEKEMRMVQMWGDGRVPWVKKGERNHLAGRHSLQHNYVDDELAKPAPKPQGIPNIEGMTESEFNKYLDYLRSRRDELRLQIFSPPESGAGMPAEVSTLPHAARKIASDTASADFQAHITAKDFSEPSSTRLHGRPHKLHGLAYSSAPAAGATLDPSRVHKGRVLDTVRSTRTAAGGFRGSFRGAADINTEWVIGMGGMTALGASGVTRVSDKARLSQFDFTRQRPEKGIADFKVSEAVLEGAPRVLNLNSKASGGARYTDTSRKRPSQLFQLQPLSSFRFDIKVEEEPNVDAPEAGSAKWVAREHVAAPVGNEGSMGVLGGLGGPKASRIGGAGRAAASRLGLGEGQTTIDSLLARIGGKDQ